MKNYLRISCKMQKHFLPNNVNLQNTNDDHPKQSAFKHLCLLIALFLISTNSFAASITWTGNTSTDWATATNWNLGHVPTAADDEIIIDNTTNQPIVSGTVPTINLMYINENASLTINSGGTLNVNASAVASSITMQGANTLLTNNGIINVGFGAGVGITIDGECIINNYGTINTNNLYGISTYFTSNVTIQNYSTGIINSDFKITGTTVFNLTNNGTINYAGGTYGLSFSSASNMTNFGTINISGGDGINNPSGSAITNDACGKIVMTVGGYTNEGSTTNNGYIQLPNTGLFSNTGTFTNNAVVKANTVPSITNNNLIISNACPYFTKGGSSNYTVTGIFTDAAATISAGIFNATTNKLNPSSTLPLGSQTLYAQVTDGTCNFVVPYTYTNIKPTFTQIVSCAGVNFNLPSTSTNGISGGWSPTKNLNTTTTYTFTPNASFCADTATMTVVVNPNPNSFLINGGVYCPGTITLTGPVDPNYTYTWQYSLTGLTNPNTFSTYGGFASSQTVNTGGVYQLIVTDQNGCSTSDTAAVVLADYIFNGSLVAGDLEQTGRMNRFANATKCASPTTFQGDFTTSGQRLYDSYSIVNPTNSAICAKIGLSNTCGFNIFCSAYLGSYNPTSFGTNYLADHGSSFTFQSFYEATIPANSTMVVVVHEVIPNTGCSSYQLSVELPRDASTVSASSGTVACNGTTILTAPLASSYLWSPGAATTQTITTAALNETNNKYYVTLGYGNAGCTSLDSITIALQCNVNINAKALLSGPYITSTGLMQDSLRTKGIIPITEPYSSAPYNTIFVHQNGGGGEVANASLFTTTGNDAIVDWVFVELRSATDFNVVVATKAGLIQRDGDIVSADDGGPLQINSDAGNYYVAVKHRNHLGVMTANSIALSTTPTTLDFTNTSLALYSRTTPNHNPLPLTGTTKILGGKRALYAGNCNLVGAASRYILYGNSINSDRTSLFATTGSTGTLNGYSIFDVDMNGYARFNGFNPDRLVILNTCVNTSNTLFVNEQTPN